MMRHTRRTVLKLSGAAACAPLLTRYAFAQQSAGSHGMTVIGELKYPRGFTQFDWVNPAAPRGGRIVTQLPAWLFNQNPSTFNTLNHYVLRGDGAAGMGLTFASLMTAVHRRARQRLCACGARGGDLRRRQVAALPSQSRCGVP